MARGVRFWLERLKPAGSRQTHLLLAAFMWTVIGMGLLTVGIYWSSGNPSRLRWLWLAIALVAGAAKALFVLRKTAARTAVRIRRRGDGKCVGGFLSISSWLLVLTMMLGGRFLRSGMLSLHWVGLLYAGVGMALLLASIHTWRAWREVQNEERRTDRTQGEVNGAVLDTKVSRIRERSRRPPPSENAE